MGNSAIGRGTAIEENKVKASSGATADFLDGIVDGDTIQVVADTLVGAVTQSTVGSFARDAAGATGTVAYTGVGFQPTAIWFIMVQNVISTDGRLSHGFSDGTNDSVLYRQNAGTDGYGRSNSYSIYYVGSALSQLGAISTFDSDGFTIQWTKNGSPVDTLNCSYIAIR